MAKFTIVIEDNILKRAHVWALEEGRSVNAIVLDYLADYAGMKVQKDKPIEDLLQLSQRAKSIRGNCRWTREDVHQR